jgi:propionyl-CoA carboxylase beta chain
MFVTGPNVVKTVTHEEVTSEDLGGASTHASKSGVAHFTAPNELDAIRPGRQLILYSQQLRRGSSRAALHTIGRVASGAGHHHARESQSAVRHTRGAERGHRPGQQHGGTRGICAEHGHRIRPRGRPNRGVRGQPACTSCRGAGHRCECEGRTFRALLRCIQHPLARLRGRTRFPPGTDQEWRGIINHGAKLLYAFSEATVPRITVITRKAYGGAYDVMNSKHIGCDMNFAWPCAEIAVMGAKGAAEIIFKGEIAKADDPAAKWQEKEAQYKEQFANPYEAAARGYVDEVIRPSQTRSKIIAALDMLRNKVEKLPRKKHGNIPL